MDEIRLKTVLFSGDCVQICRSCLSLDAGNKDMFLISHVVEDSCHLFLHEIFFKCTQIMMNADECLPKSLCVECIGKMTEAYKFYTQCHDAQKKLIELYNSKHSDKKEDLPINTGPNVIISNEYDDEAVLLLGADGSDCLEECYANENNGTDIVYDSQQTSGYEKKEDKEQEDVMTNNKIKKKQKKQYPPLYDNPEQPQTCSICFESCSDVQDLIKHRCLQHGKNKFQCLECGNGFTTTRGLRIHARQHSGEKPEVCSVCHKGFSDPRTLKNHERLHNGDQRFPCTLCHKKYSSRSALSDHMNSHQEQRPYQCTLCPRTYRQAVSLKVHMRTHMGHRPHKCSQCDRSFTNKTSLNVHALTHKGVKNFQCTICGIRVSRSGQLVIHMRSHSGERPYACPQCHKAFTSSGALASHMPTHTGEKNYSCFICGKRLARSNELKVHLHSHNNNGELQQRQRHTCGQCGRDFSTRNNMMVHQRKHTGEKPHGCEECGRKFSDAHLLKKHLLTHKSRQLPHACPHSQCHRRFRQLATLRTHQASHDKDIFKTESVNVKTIDETTNNRKKSKPRISVIVGEDIHHENVQQQQGNAVLHVNVPPNNFIYSETTQLYINNSFIS